MKNVPPILLIPDAGPLITLAYADALDVLFKPAWAVYIVDMVLHEVTRNQTPTSQAIANWVTTHQLHVVPTKTFQHFQTLQKSSDGSPRKANLAELAIQETMNDFALIDPPPICVFLFEDHRIARTPFLLPSNCRKVSTRAFLLFLEQKAWIASVVKIERNAIQNGRHFSQLKYPPT